MACCVLLRHPHAMLVQGRATVDGRVLPAPIYCEHESLRGSASGKVSRAEICMPL